MKKILGIICLIYDAIILYIIITNSLKNFLAPNMQIYIKISVIPLFIISIYLLTNKDKHLHFKLSDLILLLPVIMIILSGNGRLTETLATNKMIKIDNIPPIDTKTINSDETNDKNEKSVAKINEIDFDIKDETYEYLANYFTTKEKALKYENKTIKVKGFVVMNSFMPAGYFAIGKYSISCCAADATYAGYIAKYDINNIKENNWYEIEGILKRVSWPSGNDILVIDAVNVKEISSSEEEQYVYPCYSYDDGTCKDLMKYDLE